MYPESFHAGIMGGKALPYDAKVEYLYSNGNQHIRTNVELEDDDVVIARFKLYGSDQCFFGCRIAAYNNAFMFFPGADAFYSQIGSVSLRINLTAFVNKVVEIRLGGGSSVLKIDGHTIFNEPISGTIENPQKCWLFAANQNNQVNRPMVGYGYYFEVIGKSRMIPVRKGNEGFMYDERSGQLFGNAGTGAFTVGPDVA